MRIYTAVFGGLMISAWMLLTSRGDTQVSCVFMEQCTLPCTSEGITDLIIHWFKAAGDLRVHSFYYNQDQLRRQDQRFRGRTSLFKEQISRGNASLQLTGVEVRDEGRYRCHTSTYSGAHDSFISLKIHAPVRKVNIQQVGNVITCSSEGIYPEPELTWTNMTSNSTTVRQTEEQLYSISSSLSLSDSDAYSCTISSHRSRKRATLFKPASILWSDAETTVPCPPSHAPPSNLVWRFNHSRTIVTRAGADLSYRVHAGWEQHVEKVSESGSLTLQGLTSEHEGIYTCELSDAEDTQISEVMIVMNAASKSKDPPLHRTHVGLIIGGILVIVVIVVLILIIINRSRVTEATKSFNGETSDTNQPGSSETEHLQCNNS